MKRPPKSNFPHALRTARKARGIAQEDIEVSGRTYISAIERGIKVPTLGKVEQLAEALRMHPLTLLALAYLPRVREDDVELLLSRVSVELAELQPVD
jgi:transcriptional regulator with XRE-family HTH domain